MFDENRFSCPSESCLSQIHVDSEKSIKIKSGVSEEESDDNFSKDSDLCNYDIVEDLNI